MYREARFYAGMSAEEAAFRLSVGIRTLYRYERGETVPPADVVCMMAKTYRKPEMLHRYCLDSCPIGMQHGCQVEKEPAVVA